MFHYESAKFAGLPRAKFIAALAKEGLAASSGYTSLNTSAHVKALASNPHYQRLYGKDTMARWVDRNQCPVNDRLVEAAVWFGQTKLLGSRTDMEKIAAAVTGIQLRAGELARFDVPIRETPGTTLAELRAAVDKPESELPSFAWAVAPVILPIALISLASFMVIGKGNAGFVKFFGGKESFDSAFAFIEFIGNKNVALLAGALISMFVLARQKGHTVAKICELITLPLETAGSIILITAAGGAFGLMLRNVGVGEAIKAAAAGHDLNMLWLAYLVAVVLRVAQGSATVAMLTTSAMMYPIMTAGSGLPCDPLYLFLAIGFGGFALSWMNDSSFWIVSKLGGLTEGETLKTWTVLLTVNSFVGMVATWLLSLAFPFPMGKPGQ